MNGGSISVGVSAALLALSIAIGCGGDSKPEPASGSPAAPPAVGSKAPSAPVAPPATQPHIPMGRPVPLWEGGKAVRMIDAALAERAYLVLDLGEAWTPYLFADATKPDGTPVSSSYKPIYQALARGEYPDNLQGQRAQDDKYLELYGILPTLALERKRMRATRKLACAAELDLEPLLNYTGVETYTTNDDARRKLKDFAYAKGRVAALMAEQKVAAPEAIDTSALSKRDQSAVARYIAWLPDQRAVEAMQARLKCEGYLARRGRYMKGVIDWATHEALAEFERRHRVFSWGFIGKDSLVPLRMRPIEADREALLRILTERAIHTAGVIEDGSTSTLANGQPRLWQASDGKAYPIPNLVAELRQSLVEAFGLQTPESTLAWLESLGELPPDANRYVAVKMPELPEYYGSDMELTLDYDRGDVWYDFPFGDQGQELPQPVQRRPSVTLSVMHLGTKVPLARYGTTIGGWRAESVNGVTMWRYKESPVGPRAWEEIIAAPVWLPPDTTPQEELIVRNKKRKQPSDPEYLVNYHETGPSYASAYGLVAAYHREFFQRSDGTISLGRDEGIRTHGSVDYMSIMRRHSHGCHRLHNHIALRLMSFVLAHRPHQHQGQETLSFKKYLTYKDKTYLMDIRQGGYVFKLARPLFVNVEPGRIRGQVKRPIPFPIPKWNPEVGAYVMPDGSTVQVRGSQLIQLTPPLVAASTEALVPSPPSALVRPAAIGGGVHTTTATVQVGGSRPRAPLP